MFSGPINWGQDLELWWENRSRKIELAFVSVTSLIAIRAGLKLTEAALSLSEWTPHASLKQNWSPSLTSKMQLTATTIKKKSKIGEKKV